MILDYDGAICTKITFNFIIDMALLCCHVTDVSTNGNMQNFLQHMMCICVKSSNNHINTAYVNSNTDFELFMTLNPNTGTLKCVWFSQV